MYIILISDTVGWKKACIIIHYFLAPQEVDSALENGIVCLNLLGHQYN